MPAYTIEQFADEPIVVCVMDKDYELPSEEQQGKGYILELLDTLSAPVYFIFDLRAMPMNFNSLLQGVSMATQQYMMFTHRNIIEVVLISEKPYLKAAMSGLRNPLFGNIKVQVFDTVDTALAYARSQIAAGQP